MLSAAMALALGGITTNAHALAFGRLNVQSALGEPLRAEIEVAEITAAEADGMKVNIASAEAFRAAGVAYNASLSDVRATLQRRADGRYVVRLAGKRSLNDPFIDLLLEANWSSGRIVRDYTVLLDPPTARQPDTTTAVAPLPPQMAAPAPSPRSAPVAVAQPPAPRRERPVPAAPVRVAAEPNVPTGSGEQQVTVRTGDTASKIAGAYKPADVSLDQMLVALLRANPNAFIGGNINRMKAGAVIDVPSAAQASALPPDEARRTVTAQSRDFGDYRRRLAENAPLTRVANADRQASGKLQTNVNDRNAAAASPDKLTISQGNTAERTAEDQVARDRKAQDEKARVAELAKNISDLNKLQAASGSTAAAPAVPAPSVTTPSMAVPAVSAPAAPVAAATPATAVPPATPAPAATAIAPTAAASAPAPNAVASAPAAEPVVAPVAATPAPAPKPVVKAAPPPAPQERGFFAELLENPVMLAGAALIALLIGFLLYRVLGRKRRDAVDSVFLESRMPKDSFFGANGGESVDTKNRDSSVVSSLSYSPSQLDAGDVDPVAEADVYLAYGRDLQAEEILREAMRVNPERTAIQLKLLEIHAKRRDLRAYEALATDVHKLTGGNGTEWNRVVDMGKDLDPGNPLYEAGTRTAAPVAAEAAAVAADAGAAAPIAKAAPSATDLDAAAPPAFVPSVAPLDFDLDLRKPPAPANAAPVSASLPTAAAAVVAVAAGAKSLLGGRDEINLENDFDTAPSPLESITRTASLEGDHTQPATLRAGLPGDSGFIEFDMSALGNLPLSSGDTEAARLEPLDEGTESPHAIKLSLARELQALGDVEGARSLVEEVEAESSGDVKSQAKQLLAQLA